MSCKKGHEVVDGCECIECISCQVSSCMYNDQNHRCTAEQVKIGPQYANNSSDTVCDTFEAK